MPNGWQGLTSAVCTLFLFLFWRQVRPDCIIAAWVFVAVTSALIGICQYFGLSQVMSPWINQTNAGEAFANLRQRNQFATLTSLGLVALIGWFGRRGQTKRVSYWAYVPVVLMALGLSLIHI